MLFLYATGKSPRSTYLKSTQAKDCYHKTRHLLEVRTYQISKRQQAYLLSKHGHQTPEESLKRLPKTKLVLIGLTPLIRLVRSNAFISSKYGHAQKTVKLIMDSSNSVKAPQPITNVNANDNKGGTNFEASFLCHKTIYFV
jgi:hypothetical protein